MPRLSLWNGGLKGATYNYIDRAISEFFGISGTAIYVHLYLGPYSQDPNATTDPAVNDIQDVLFLENRDRRYSDDVYEVRGLYNVADVDFDLRQFGMFLQNDTIFIEVHLNDIVAQLGRKPMSGDVLELPHQRDDVPLNSFDPNARAINKFYVIQDVNRASDGYSPTWYPHILRLKCTPMAAAEEYSDILDKQAKDPLGFDDGTLRDILTNVGVEMDLNEQIVEAAKASVLRRNFETRQFYMVTEDYTAHFVSDGSTTTYDLSTFVRQGDTLSLYVDGNLATTGFTLTSDTLTFNVAPLAGTVIEVKHFGSDLNNPWIFAGDGDPPNGAQPVGAGNSFPSAPAEGDYYLRVDYNPHALFRYLSGRWRIQELDYREAEWSAAHSILKGFIDQTDTVTMQDGTVENVRQGLHKAVKPRADF